VSLPYIPNVLLTTLAIGRSVEQDRLVRMLIEKICRR